MNQLKETKKKEKKKRMCFFIVTGIYQQGKQLRGPRGSTLRYAI